MLNTVVLVVHISAAVGIIGLVLLQHGKGADAGAAFGSGASSTVFGARGAASFLTRTTAVLAGLFFITSISLTYLAGSEKRTTKSVTEMLAPSAVTPSTPADVPSATEGATSAPSAPAATSPATPAPPP